MDGNDDGCNMADADPLRYACDAERARYAVLERVGGGAYGVVYKALDEVTGRHVAIKVSLIEDVHDARNALHEARALRALSGTPDVVCILRVLRPAPGALRAVYVVMELLECTLKTVLKINWDLTSEHHRAFMYQLLRGLAVVHARGIAHLDIKPQNVLATSACKIKLADFGIAQPATVPLDTTVATLWYRAPEVCSGGAPFYGPPVDVWSVGCIFAEILLGRPPFVASDEGQLLQLIAWWLDPMPRNTSLMRQWLCNARTDPDAVDLLFQLLEMDPAERWTAAMALHHPYFAALPRVDVPACDQFACWPDVDSLKGAKSAIECEAAWFP